MGVRARGEGAKEEWTRLGEDKRTKRVQGAESKEYLKKGTTRKNGERGVETRLSVGKVERRENGAGEHGVEESEWRGRETDEWGD